MVLYVILGVEMRVCTELVVSKKKQNAGEKNWKKRKSHASVGFWRGITLFFLVLCAFRACVCMFPTWGDVLNDAWCDVCVVYLLEPFSHLRSVSSCAHVHMCVVCVSILVFLLNVWMDRGRCGLFFMFDT